MSPVAARLHDVVRAWLVDLLRLPADTGLAFVTGATVANASCLAAARDALLARLGWDAQADGLFDALADWMAERGGWLHVDGAFGLWALADPERADLVGGLERADSWATDGHKWLNVG